MRVHLAPLGLEDVVREELGARLKEARGRLFLVDDDQPCHFAQNTWLAPEFLSFKSISEASKHLRAIQRNWWLHSTTAHRRAELIRLQLPPLKPKPLEFGAPVPTSPLGGWTLWDEQTLLYSARTTSHFPDGEPQFAENKADPPSRAYLKLWEFFTRVGVKPAANERCLDLGSSPGGWTWVLDQLGARVVSVDKAPLASGTKFSERVEYRGESAFGLAAKAIGDVDWLFSDIICYPERLLALVEQWRPHARNMVCTIKFQGATDFATLARFLEIPGSSVCHLANNKHELTWFALTDSDSR